MRRSPSKQLSFAKLNRIRIERLTTLFPAKKQSFFELLPLLFQVNSDTLPGYHGADTPAGIVDYQPTDQAIAACQRMYPAFLYQRHTLHHYPLRGIYLINQQDFFHYSANMSFELWVVCGALTSAEYQRLNKKVAAICLWARDQFEIACHPRLFDQDTLPDALSEIERDQFYHSGLVLAGSHPQWWQLTPDEPDTKRPLQQHSRHAQLDFGSLSPPTAEHLVQLTQHALYRTMTQGLSACLDLIYYHTALHHFSEFSWLSERIKQRLTNGTSKPRQLDADYLKLDFIQRHCAKPTLIELAQYSLYILCQERLSKPVSFVALPWRREFIQDCIYQWDWPNQTDKIRQLDQRYQAPYRDAVIEAQQLQHIIQDTQTALVKFVQRHTLGMPPALHELTHTYRYLFQNSADQIPCLPPAFEAKSSEPYLYLRRDNESADWQIADQELPVGAPALYQHASLLNVLAWAIQNRLLDQHSRLKVTDKCTRISMHTVQDLVHFLLRTPLTTRRIHPQRFDQQALKECDSILVFANLDAQTPLPSGQQGLEISSLQSDPLNYAHHYQNLLVRIECLVANRAGQWFHFITQHNTAIPDCLAALLRWDTLIPDAADILCWAPPANHATKIKKRLTQLFKAVITHYLDTPDTGRFIFQIGGQFYQLQWQQGVEDVSVFPRHATFLDCLNTHKDNFPTPRFDPDIKNSALYAALLSSAQSETISLFVYKTASAIILFIIDETGFILEQSFQHIHEHTLLAHYREFINTLDGLSHALKIRVYQLQRSSASQWHVTAQAWPPPPPKTRYLPVIVELDNLSTNSPCTIYCGQHAFSGSCDNAALFHQVKDFVWQYRHHPGEYPLYISRLKIKKTNGLKIRDYLHHKHRLEIQLNQ